MTGKYEGVHGFLFLHDERSPRPGGGDRGDPAIHTG